VVKAIALYFRYALRSFERGGTRSLFGAFCVAVGVAAIVALGLIAGDFQTAITGNARQQNRGDLSVASAGGTMTVRQYTVFGRLKARGKIADYTSRLQDGAVLRNPQNAADSVLGNFGALDPKKFPFYDTITADRPAGITLRRLLARPDSAVISHDVASSLHLALGGRVALASNLGLRRLHTVTGIVPDSAWSTGLTTVTNNDFVLVNRASVAGFFRSVNIGASIVYVLTRDAAQATQLKAELQRRFGDLATIKTVADVEHDAHNSATNFGRFLRIMGLVAVAIGGIGIMNTMLVTARRRTKGIAVLKALGMKGRQVVLVFALESLILAAAGTILGVGLGVLCSLVVRGAAQSLTGLSIPWAVHPDALVAGVLVGLVATVLSAFLPVLQASRARPIAALRGEAAEPSKQGRLRTGLPALGLAALTGYLAVLYTGFGSGAIALLSGVAVGVGALVGATLLTEMFAGMVWLVSRLPSLGRLAPRMALRSMGAQRQRLATTLLALCIGMLAIAASAILAQNLKSAEAGAVQRQQNLNVAVQSAQQPAVVERVRSTVATLPGIRHQEAGAVDTALTLTRVDGRSVAAITRDALRRHTQSRSALQVVANELRGVEARDLRHGGYTLSMTAGRALSSRDAGTDHLVVPADLATPLGIRVGSHVVFAEGSRRLDFTVVGISDSSSLTITTIFFPTQADLGYLQRMGLTTPSPSHLSVLYLRIDDGALHSDVARLRQALPQASVLDLSKYLPLFDKLIDRLTLFPEILAALSLFAGAVIIANTVALAMLERRREIGVLKAVGARRRTILEFLLLENAVVGFLGALVGIILAMAIATVADGLYLQVVPSFDPITIGGLLLLGVALAVGASSLTALPASTERPMAVLRYE
jgi:predicted lysophospholipase L1 biosynthesis ABC-type transport system permease subunit